MKKLIIALLFLIGVTSCVEQIFPMEASAEWICKWGEDLNGDGVIDEADWLIYTYGKDGKDGLSAYELWLTHVEDGLIDPKTGEEWPKDKTGVTHYYAYLTGNDGRDGINGLNGEDAFDLWCRLIRTGLIEYPGYDGGDLTYIDFFLFLKGKDGKDGADGLNGLDGKDGTNGGDGSNGLSAYELWLVSEDVADMNEDEVIDIYDWYLFIKGEKGDIGDTGSKGVDGKSAYEIWLDMLEDGTITDWDSGNTILDFYEYLTGSDGLNGNDGRDGQDGENGLTPRIGDNGHWWIGDTDAGIKARGDDGDNGKDGQNGRDGIDGTPGSVVTIGENGNWFIDGEDTGVPSRGQDGEDGKIAGEIFGKFIDAYYIWKVGKTGNNAEVTDFLEWLQANPNNDLFPLYQD